MMKRSLKRKSKRSYARSFVYIILIILSLLALYFYGESKKTSALTQDQEKFSLKEDLFDFSSKLNNGDTIVLTANISVCASLRFEKDIITKENNKVFIQSEASGFMVDEWNVKLPKTEYTFNPFDSLNFENLFRYVDKKDTTNNSIYNNTFLLTFKCDTIKYYSNGLGEQVPNSIYYLSIKRRLYPEQKIYEPLEEAPLPPKPPFDTTTLPNELIEYVESAYPEYRLPIVNDYPEYYFTGYSVDNVLPYYCTGYFNNDSLIDYALLLLKDSTEQLILSLHQLDEGYNSYGLSRMSLVFDSETKKWYVSQIIETETEKVLEAIDTTFYLKNDAIAISDMEESRSKVMVWNDMTNNYSDLVFD